jgi:NAD+ kinase
MRIGLYANPDKDPAYTVSCRTAALITEQGAVCVISPDDRHTPLAASPSAEVGAYASCDLLICLGGDGTFLSAVHLPGCESIPVVGVNLGSVGFLPEILPESLPAAIRALVARHYRLEQRMMLWVSCYGADQALLEEGFALAANPGSSIWN